MPGKPRPVQPTTRPIRHKEWQPDEYAAEQRKQSGDYDAYLRKAEKEKADPETVKMQIANIKAILEQRNGVAEAAG